MSNRFLLESPKVLVCHPPPMAQPSRYLPPDTNSQFSVSPTPALTYTDAQTGLYPLLHILTPLPRSSGSGSCRARKGGSGEGIFPLLTVLNNQRFFFSHGKKKNQPERKTQSISLVSGGKGTSLGTARLGDLHDLKRNKRKPWVGRGARRVPGRFLRKAAAP